MTPSVSEWLHGFVLPLVAGGDVRVRGALGSLELETLTATAAADDSAAPIAEARHQVAAELFYDATRPGLDADSLRLAAAVQNLLFLSHPEARGLGVGARRRREVALFSTGLASLPAPDSLDALAARHTLVHHLFDLGRDDVRVSFWAGSREFRGAEPPGRLLKWPGVRRVREERWRVGVVAEAVADPSQRAIVAALLAASPLTDLLEPARLEPRLDLRPLAPWLRLPMVARAVADRYLTLGLEQIGPAYTLAAIDLYHQKSSPKQARTATAFLCHLQLLSLLGEAQLSEQSRRIRLETLVQRHESLRDFFGLFAAAERVGLGRPLDVRSDARLESLIDSHARICLQLCGAARVLELEGVMTLGIGEPTPAHQGE